MSALDDRGTIVTPVCPLCESWSVTVSLDDVAWPLAGLLVEQAIDEHVDEHVSARPYVSTATLGLLGRNALG